MNKAKLMCAAALLVAWCSEGYGQQIDAGRPPVQLKIDWQPGRTYLQAMEMEQSLAIPMGDRAVSQGSKMTIEMSMKVSAVGTAGLREVETRHERFRIEMDMAGQKMAYDSAKPEDASSPFAAAGGVVGKPFIMVVNDKNRIVEVRGLDEISRSVGGTPLSAKMLQQFGSKEALDQIMNTWVTQTFPQRPVKPGEQWPFDVSMNLGEVGRIRMVGTYHFAGFASHAGADCAVLDVDGRMEMDLKAPGEDEASKALAAAMPQLRDGSSKGRIYWDNDLGWMRGMELNQKMKMVMGNPAGGAEISIPMEQKIRSTVTVK